MTDAAADPGAGPVSGLAVPGSGALLVGSGRHDPGSGLPDVPAVGRTLRDLADALAHRCALPVAGITVIEDPPEPGALGVAIARRAADVTGVLYLHYVGHGLIGPGGDLHLATAASRRELGLLPFTSLPWTALREALRESPAAAIVVVLDCCFSGRATGTLGDRPRAGLDVAQARGTYVLTSSAAAEVSLARPGAAHTAFSGELIRLLTEGDERLPDRLTLSTVFDHLDRELPRRGLPAPRRFSTGRTDRLVLAANPARFGSERVAPDAVPDTGPATACPYLGLQPFRVGDAPLFHGRERLTQELVDRLGERFPSGAPLVVVGASGAGKSSLLNAGLLPALGRGELPVPGSATWPVLVVVPGADPVAALVPAVRELVPDLDPAAAERELRADPACLARLLRRARPAAADGSPPQPVVLVVDQFEDVFAGPDEAAHRAFVDAVCGAAGAGAAIVVLGLRADFYGQAVTHPALRDALARDPLLVGPMTADELRSAIEKPAHAAGLTLEPGLPELLLADLGVRGNDDTAYDAGRLPLLSHAMFATWRRRSGDTLTVAGYRSAGRVDGAVAETAERVFAGLTPQQQVDARRILLRLVMVGDGTPDTRARIPREVIGPEAWPVLRVLAAEDARLVTLDRDTAELSHDSLLHAWTRLRRWIADDRAGRVIHQRAAQAAQAWLRGGQRDADLYTGTRLSAFQEWAATHPDEPAHPERVFLDASLRAAERTERLRRRFTRGLAALLAISLAATGIAVWQWRTAAARERVATARSLAAQAASLRDIAPDRAIALALAAYRTDPGPQARTALADELARSHLVGLGPDVTGASVVAFHPRLPVLVTGGVGDFGVALSSLADDDWGRRLSEPSVELSGVYGVAFSPDGGLLAAEGGNGLPRADGLVDEPYTLARVRVWDMRDTQRPRLLAELPESGRPAFSDGRTLVTVTGRRAVVWDLTTPARPRRVATVGDDVASVAVAPNGRLLATFTPEGDIRLWDLAAPSRSPAMLSGTQLAFSPTGDRAVVVSRDEELQLWDLTNPALPERIAAPEAPQLDPAALAVFSPDGTSLAAVGADRRITVWRLAPGTPPQVIANFGTGHADPVTALAFGPDGSTLATAAAADHGHDSRARVWRVRPAADAAVIARAEALTAVSAIAVTRDGTVVAHGQGAGRVVLRRPAAGLAEAAELRTSLRRAESTAFSPDGRVLAVGGATGSDDDERSSVELWDVADPGRRSRLAVLVPPGEGVPDLEFAPGGATLAVISELQRGRENHQDVTLWDTASPARARRLVTFDVHLNTGSQTAEGRVRFSTDGRLLGTVSGERDAAVWSVADRNRPRRVAVLEHDEWFHGWPSRAAALAFGPDSRYVATADGGSVLLWDLRDPSKPRKAGVLAVRNTNDDPAPIELAFGGGADLLAVAFSNGVVRLLETGTPEQPVGLTQLVDRGPVLTGSGVPAIDAAGRRLVTAGPTEVVVRDTGGLAQLTARPLLEWACAVVGSAFNKRQWEEELAPNLPSKRTCPPRP